MPPYQLCSVPKLGFGKPPAGSKLYSYAAGTTTPLATAKDAAGAIFNTNPIIFDSRGEADVWLLIGTGYKLVHTSATDVPIWTVDGIIEQSGGGGGVGPQGPAGPAGPSGPQGPSGSGIPSGAAIEMITGIFTAAPYAGQAEIPLAGFFPAFKRILHVELTGTQQFGTSNGLTGLSLGDATTQDRWGNALTLITGVKAQRDGGVPMYTTATTLSLFAEGGLFDATGAASVRAMVTSLV